MKKKIYVIGVGESAGRMYYVNLQRASDKTIATSDVTRNSLSVWHARLAHANWNEINKIGQKSAVHGLEMVEAGYTNNCLLCVGETITNTIMPY